MPSLHCSSNVNSAFKAFAVFECTPCVHQPVTSLGPVLKIFYFLIKILSTCTQVGVFLGLINFVKSLYACSPLQSLQYFLAFWGSPFQTFGQKSGALVILVRMDVPCCIHTGEQMMGFPNTGETMANPPLVWYYSEL